MCKINKNNKKVRTYRQAAISLNNVNDKVIKLENSNRTTPISMKNLDNRINNLVATAKKWKIWNFSKSNNVDATDEIGFKITNSTIIFAIVTSVGGMSDYTPTWINPSTSNFTINTSSKSGMKRENNRIKFYNTLPTTITHNGYLILMD